MKHWDEIYAYVQDLEIIDSHEHLPYREDAREKHTDVLEEYLIHYFDRDLVSAGLTPADMLRVKDHNLPLMARWRLVEPYWLNARHTGYGRALQISAKELYGIEQISGDTIMALDEKFQRSLQPGHFQKVLKEKCRIKASLLDCNLDCDQTFFKSVFRIDTLVYPRTIREIYALGEACGVAIASFDDWLEACVKTLDDAFARGAVALKCALAYQRTLKYERVTRQQAEQAFHKLLFLENFPDWEEPVIVSGKAFQDYMMHFILDYANKRRLTIQFHTGLQEGNGNYIEYSDPTLLGNLFLAYKQVDFDLFHIGYPFQHMVGALAKTFPNVYIDMCWAHIISPQACMQALNEWIDCVPVNKITAFGGDYKIIDAVYGHQYLARRDVAMVLARKVEEGLFDVKEAKRIAKLLFYDNPYRLFKLEGKL